MYASSVLARAKAALQGSETEQRIAVLLYDDTVQVISSFELNQLASLTYHEDNVLTSSRHDIIEILLSHLEQIMSQPINYSIVSVQKALVVTKHILLHGAEKIVPCIKQQLARPIDMLRQYNTVLAAQQQSSSTAWLLRLKGGGVDSAGPVRNLSETIFTLLSDMQRLQFERCASADPTSLVPIGDRKQVAFVTDDVRLVQLKKRMEEEQSVITRSNLAKASDGFGSGYMSANGKSIVGAAHGIEEMLKQKQKEEQRFSDESKVNPRLNIEDTGAFSEYMAPNIYENNTIINLQQSEKKQSTHDLLSLDSNTQFYESTSAKGATQSTSNVDLLDLGFCDTSLDGNKSVEKNLLNESSTYPSHINSQGLDMHHSYNFDVRKNAEFAPMNFTVQNPPNMIGTNSYSSSNTGSVHVASSISNTTLDRFAALDALTSNSHNTNGLLNKTAFTGLDFHVSKQQTNISSNYMLNLNGSTLSNNTAMHTSQHQADNINKLNMPISSIKVSQSLGNDSETDGNGFLMGGLSGTGLEPIGSAPATAPPPPGQFF